MSRYIDADALKKEIASLHILNDEKEIRRAYYANPHTTMTDFEETLVGVFDCIDDAPTIEPKRGEWIEKEECWQCSECGDEYVLEVDVKPIDAKMYYCPNCGARMKGSDDE